MARLKERARAIQLRKQGLSFSQIKENIGISKSTLSSWLYQYPLSQKRINELRGRSEIRIEKFRQTMRHKREVRLAEIYKQAKKELLPLSPRELLVAGLCLYWGEGTKSDWSKITIANTDPLILKFFIYWLTLLAIPKTSLKVALQLYSDMNIKDEMDFWSTTLDIPLKQFIKPYIKQTMSARINHKGSFGHGTCTVSIYKVILKEKIMMQIKAIAEHYSRL